MAMSDTGIRIPVLPHGPITDGTNQFWANGRPFSIEHIPVYQLGDRAYDIGEPVAREIYGRTDSKFMVDMIARYYDNGNIVLVKDGEKIAGSFVYQIHPEANIMELSYGYVDPIHRNGNFRIGDKILSDNIALAERLGLDFAFARSSCSCGIKSLLRGGLRTPLLGHDLPVDIFRERLGKIGYDVDERLRFDMSTLPFYEKYPLQMGWGEDPRVKNILSQLDSNQTAVLGIELGYSTDQEKMTEHIPDIYLPTQDFSLPEPLQDHSLSL
jgi:hypothetical protein